LPLEKALALANAKAIKPVGNLASKAPVYEIAATPDPKQLLKNPLRRTTTSSASSASMLLIYLIGTERYKERVNSIRDSNKFYS